MTLRFSMRFAVFLTIWQTVTFSTGRLTSATSKLPWLKAGGIISFARPSRCYGARVQPFHRSYCVPCEGLMDDQAPQVLLRDEKALIQYAYKVAGTVGFPMWRFSTTAIPGPSSRSRPRHCDAIDQHCSRRVGGCKNGAPLSTRRVGKSHDASRIVAAASNQTGPMACRSPELLNVLALAEVYYASGRAGLAYLPLRAHFSIGVAAKVYRQIGRQLLRSKRSWHGGRQVTSKGSKVFCTLRASTSLVRRIPVGRRSHNAHLHAWLKPYKHQGGGW